MTRFLVLMLLGLSCARARKVNKHKPWIEASYQGIIMENTDVVLLNPPLVALDKDAPEPYAGEICGFDIQGVDAAFEAVLLNSTSGEGQLRAIQPIDCESQREFTFVIQARDCGTDPKGYRQRRSHKAVVHIQVGDVNEFPPMFRRMEYDGWVAEGKVSDSILQVQASDQDCSPQYSQICDYHITSQDTAFAVDRNGHIRNTVSLSFDEKPLYVLRVTALDCGQKKAEWDAIVHIHVKPVCRAGWQGWNKYVNYTLGTGSMQLFPKMHLETCNVSSVSWIRTTVELQTSNAGEACNQHSYSEGTLQRMCGVSSDLLPAYSAASNWTSSLVLDSDPDREVIYRFDGHQAATVPEWVVPQNLTDKFTISTWMKHGPSPGLRVEKETLLCNSDKTEMNRHHYSLYVHNCRLVLLLRTDYTHTDSFRPAEFHWKLEQICDKEWHFYIISIAFPVVTLYVDGVTFDPYLVTDDWTIHSSQIDVQLTVGACWQGGEVSKTKFTQFFRGCLSGLTIRLGKMESWNILSCLQGCKEALDISSLSSVAQKVKFHLNPAQCLLVMEGEDLEQMNAALKKLSYINTQQFPITGARHLRISTTVQCFGEDECISVPEIEAVVMVMQPNQPHITIIGVEQLTVHASDLALGLSPFRDLHIMITPNKSDKLTYKSEQNTPEEIIPYVEYCDITALGAELLAGMENFELNHRFLLGKHLEISSSRNSLSIHGVDSISHYTEVIRQVRYHNRGAVDPVRTIRISCSVLNGRHPNAQFTLQVNILHNETLGKHTSHVMEPSKHIQINHTVLQSDVYSSMVTAVVVVCVAALVVLMGVYHLYHIDTQAGKPLHCDISLLSITVNPLQSVLELQSEEDISEDEREEQWSNKTTSKLSDKLLNTGNSPGDL